VPSAELPETPISGERRSESAYTASVNAAYTTMVTTIADARDAYHDDTPESDDPGTDPGGDPAGMLPVKRDFDAAAAAAQQAADADADYQKALAAANLQLALDTNAAGEDQPALAAAQAAYDSAVAAALLAYQQSVTDAQGDQSVADAQAVDDYVDEVYGGDGAYQTWQDAVSGAEEAYKTAESAAKETRDKNLAALDAALEAALADTYADALELLAINHPSPWATRAAADARAKSDRVASEQAAQLTYDEAVATAQADFAKTVAAAEQTRSDAQTDAVRALKTTLSDANLDKASDQKTTNDTAATNGASTKNPDAETPPDAPEDVTGTFESREAGETTGGFVTPAPLDPTRADSSSSATDTRDTYYTDMDQPVLDVRVHAITRGRDCVVLSVTIRRLPNDAWNEAAVRAGFDETAPKNERLGLYYPNLWLALDARAPHNYYLDGMAGYSLQYEEGAIVSVVPVVPNQIAVPPHITHNEWTAPLPPESRPPAQHPPVLTQDRIDAWNADVDAWFTQVVDRIDLKTPVVLSLRRTERQGEFDIYVWYGDSLYWKHGGIAHASMGHWKLNWRTESAAEGGEGELVLSWQWQGQTQVPRWLRRLYGAHGKMVPHGNFPTRRVYTPPQQPFDYQLFEVKYTARDWYCPN